MGFTRIVVIGFVVLNAVNLAGCAVEKPDTYAESHHRWWAEHRQNESYEARHAYHVHRGWCEDHPTDDSCAGWYHG